MKLTKKIIADLAKAYRCTMAVSILDMQAPLSYITEYIAENIKGYGTAADEKVCSRADYRRMITAGRKQSKGKVFKAKILTPYKPWFSDEATAQFQDEIQVQVGSGKDKHTLHLWMSTVFKRKDDRWQMVLFHGSIPDTASSSADTFHIKEAEKKVKELERVVAQRTLDLQNKNRELEIEAALERVRARTMAMQHSTELSDVVYVLYKQMQQLGFDYGACTITLMNEATDDTDWWMAGFSELEYPDCYHVNSFDHPGYKAVLNAWKRKEKFASIEIKGASKRAYDKIILSETGFSKLPEHVKAMMAGFKSVVYSMAYMRYGALSFGPTSISDAQKYMLQKFAEVFEQTYTRFLDLQKAEAQAREAQIEAALERVRSRSMAMHKSNELKDVIKVVLEQFVQLNINVGHAGFYIDYKAHDDMHIWLADPNIEPFFAVIPYFNTPTWNSFIEAKARGTMLHTDLLDFKTKNKFYKSLFKLFTVPEDAQQFYMQCKGLAVSTVLLENVGLYIENFSAIPYTDEENEILIRFGKVFQQTYTRFLDLQKAEAQAREAQIQLALERIRARTMAMHSSDELGDAATIMFDQLKKLGVKLWAATFDIWKPGDEFAIEYAAGPDGKFLRPFKNFIDYNLPATKYALAEFEKGNKLIEVVYSDEALKEGNKKFLTQPETKDIFESFLNAGYAFPEFQVNHLAVFSNGFLQFISTERCPEAHEIFLRMAIVFDQTYTRFQDLQKVEAQAREALIEAALERVRAQTMAMHNSEDVGKCVVKMFAELTALGVDEGTRFGIGILNHDNENNQLWTAKKDGEEVKMHIGNLDMTSHPLLKSARKAWKAQVPSHLYVLEGEDLLQYYQMLNNAPDYKIQIPLENLPEKEIQYCFIFEHGFFYAFTPHEFQPNLLNIIQRFSSVFSQTYRRYLDLVKAEAQARESQIEAALEKVRSRTMAMQSSEELADAAYVLFEQLNILGVTHERINIGIVNETQQTIDFWVTEQGGEKLNTKFSGRISEPTTLSKAYEAWKKGGKSLMVDLKGEELKHWLKYINEEIKIPFNNAFLHDRRIQTVGFFSKGMLVVTSPEPLQEEALYLLEKFAGVFDLTYTRFSDLKLAEAQAVQAEQDLIAIKEAKQKAEVALSELQATQKQLIQAEKMASLGELTAGIAHEIQNPLNFVNNFSEVNKELLAEMEAAIQKGDFEEAKALAKDIADNQEKINHHGKRADGIVKSMLQHSRTSTGKKELTDINGMCDEYLRLAYHGLRAKDKSFNAKFETRFDPLVGKLMVLSQDIGRVVLNLINNAFYAVTEKKKLNIEGYEPTVTVFTKKLEDKIQITIQDNGTGIPEPIKDKIFQPFFTTKPTGQGTGLGLSLSYDIVKAHGGELKVETKSGEGSDFIIRLNTDSQ